MIMRRLRYTALAATAGGLLLQSGCSVADAVLQTIGLAFSIVDVWA